jgi:N-acetylmuramoyl-L-alanine amidase
MTRAGQGQAVVLKISLAATDEATFAAGMGAAPDAEEATLPVAPPQEKAANAKPVVLIDPGHGGIDPGAIGAGNVTEKSIVFAVAQQLEAVLKASNRYDVRMTRTRDVFVPLDKRVKMSVEFSADLFISLHADAIAELAYAENIRGATVYTLSERATDERSRLMAEKENSSDLIAGLSGVDEDGGDQVKDILYDLLRRETLNFSADFSNLLVSRLSKNIAMSKDPQKSAAFKVLKQPHAPSVLIELGYMSNSRDQATMTTKAWQTKVAGAIGAAVDSYFNKRTAVHP